MPSSTLVSVIDVHDPPTGMGLSPLVGDGVAIETGEVQKYFSLFGADLANNSAVLQFGCGKIYLLDGMIDIPGGVGGKISSGGLSHGGATHDRWNYTTTFRAGGGYGGTMFYVKSHAGLVFDGVMFDGTNRAGTGIGLEVVANSVDGINGAMHIYRNCAFYGLAKAWTHDKDSLDGGNSNGDRYKFENVDIRQCEQAIFINSAGNMQTFLSHVTFSGVTYPITYGDGQATATGGQMRGDNILLTHSHRFLRVWDASSSNAGFFFTNLKIDDSGQTYRQKLYEEMPFGGGDDGRIRGSIVFDKVNYAKNCRNDGTIIGINDVGGFAQLRLIHHNASILATVIVDDFIHLKGTGNPAYDFDTNKIEFTATADAVGGAGEFLVDTNIPFAGDPGAIGTWFEVTPIFRQMGGSSISLRDSFIPDGVRTDASLFRSQNSNYPVGSGTSSVISVERLTNVPAPTVSVVDELITLEDNEATGSFPFFKFSECKDDTGLSSPWGESNYSGGESVDWTDSERNQIRYALGIDGDRAQPVDPDGAKLVDMDGLSLQEGLRVVLAAVGGRVSGVGTTTEVYRTADNSTNRLTVQLDSINNRTSITYGTT